MVHFQDQSPNTQRHAPRVLICIVLYRVSFQDSETYQTLQRAAKPLPGFDELVSVFVADNSEEPTEPPARFNGVYLHDRTNPGLARRYNQALQLARERGVAWLLTLDQDTALTTEYLREVLALTERLTDEPGVAVIVPKLQALGKLYSPHTSVYRHSRVLIDETSEGLLDDTLFAFNSAAVLRVSALVAIGGYDERYWLDYLDHATFAAMQRRKLRIYVMRSVLRHELAQAHGEVSAARTANILRAQQMFYVEHSHGMEWIGRKFDLLRQVIGHTRRGRLVTAREKFLLLMGRIP